MTMKHEAALRNKRGAFGKPEERTARTERDCDWCNEKIRPGDRYDHWYGIPADENEPTSFNDHVECRDARVREFESADCDHDWEAVSWGYYHDRGKTLRETSDAEARGLWE